MALNVGGVIRLTYTVKDDAGALANPNSATITITQPDGTTATPTVTLPPVSTGRLVVDFQATQAGLHSVHWATTSPITAEDDVFVAEPPKSLLISVDEAVAHLRAAGVITSDADREQLQWLCMVATDVVETDLQRVLVRRTVTETFNGGWGWVQLHNTPVLAITSVTESGTLLTGSDYLVDSSGVLWRGTTTVGRNFTAGNQNIVVVYVAGYLNPPRVARQAALNLVQAMWQTSQQASHPLISEELAEQLLPGAVEGLLPTERSAYNKLKNLAGFA